jgi:hypothetical protein
VALITGNVLKDVAAAMTVSGEPQVIAPVAEALDARFGRIAPVPSLEPEASRLPRSSTGGLP